MGEEEKPNLAYPPFHPRRQETLPLAFTEEAFREAFRSESQYVEWKRGTSGIDEAVVGFSNADGGVILIGVEDDGSVSGKELTPGLETRLHTILSTTVDPGRYSIMTTRVGETTVVVISVEMRRAGFSQTANGRTLKRRGKQNLPLMGDELRQFVNDRSLIRFETTITQVDLAQASPLCLEEVRNVLEWESADIETLRDFGLVDRGARRLTVAGVLTLTDSPGQLLGSKASVEILRFPAGSRDYDRRETIEGPVYRQVDQTTKAILDELGVEMAFIGARRYDVPRLPAVVVREAIANAVGHRQYETSGVCIRVEIHSDAVVIESPGPLPEPVTEKNLRNAQSARNLLVMKILRAFKLAEDAGRGVRVIEETMEQQLLQAPSFEDLGHAVRVRLPLGGTVSPAERAWLQKIEGDGAFLSRDRRLLVLATRDGVLTNSSVREALGIDRVEAREALQRLRDAGVIEQYGQRGGTIYRLSQQFDSLGHVMVPDDEVLRRRVLELADAGPVTNEKVRAETGIDRGQALQVLASLVDEGRLRRRGVRRGTHYVRTVPQDPLPLDGNQD